MMFSYQDRIAIFTFRRLLYCAGIYLHIITHFNIHRMFVLRFVSTTYEGLQCISYMFASLLKVKHEFKHPECIGLNIGVQISPEPLY